MPHETYSSNFVSRQSLPETWLDEFDEQIRHLKEEEEELQKYLENLRHVDGRKFTAQEIENLKK